MQPKYISRPIGSVATLAAALGVAESGLLDLASRASSSYTRFAIPKANGKPRHICTPVYDLKLIQKRINRVVFGQVVYPDYLYGGIAGRDYVQNANVHGAGKSLITLDIRDFYPNIAEKTVFELFKYFCNFPESVAGVLTKLTTLDGVVPQGACTSSHLANLVFWDTEHRVVRVLRQRKLRYSRLLDDIAVSSEKELSRKQVEDIIEPIRQMVKLKGFRLHAKKTNATTASNPKQLMEVTGLWLNRGHPRVHRSERVEIRAEIRRCEKMATISISDPTYHKEHNRLSGRVSKLAHVGHFEAVNYRARLERILPIFDQTEINRTLRLVQVVCATPTHDRLKITFLDRYYEAMYRLGILARTHPGLAKQQRVKLHACAPKKTKEELIYGT